MQTKTLSWILVCCGILGCSQYKSYLVEITPDGEGFQRKVTCWQERFGKPPEIGPVPAEDLARLKKLYGQPQTPHADAKQTFARRFVGKTPPDVGGAGSYSRFATPLGTLTAYVERFRGSDDLHAAKEKLETELGTQRAAADLLIDLVLGWFQKEMGRDPDFPKVRRLLDKEARHDLKNLLLYVWADNVRPAESEEEFALRVTQFLTEHGYLTPREVPVLLRGAESGETAVLVPLAQRLIARKIGVPDQQPIPAGLAFLSAQRAAESWTSYVRTTKLFQERLKKRETATKLDGGDKPPEPEDVVDDLLGDLAGGLFRFHLFSSPDRLEVRLSCQEEPFATNGKWDAKTNQIGWTTMLEEHQFLPMFCFALSATPDEPAQKKHFGKVRLTGDDLGEYALWYAGLTKSEAREWDEFVARWRPDGWASTLEKFRFRGDPKPDPKKPDEPPESLADVPRSILLDISPLKRLGPPVRPESSEKTLPAAPAPPPPPAPR